MERQLWKRIVGVVSELCKRDFGGICQYSDLIIIKTWLWAVLHDRPVCWACQRSNWPICQRRWQLPSASTVSRRMRSKSVLLLLDRLEKRFLGSSTETNIVWAIDGKPLPTSGHSRDPHAGYGRAVGGKAKGYKIHAIVGSNGCLADWRLAPMNKDERVMAARMLKQTRARGYFLGDSNYDSNKLHQICDDRGNRQLVTPRRYGPHRGFGNRKQSAGRMRSVNILERWDSRFGWQLFRERAVIERYFGNLVNWGGGLTHLPPWVRTYRRVYRWIQAKLIINCCKRN